MSFVVLRAMESIDRRRWVSCVRCCDAPTHHHPSLTRARAHDDDDDDDDVARARRRVHPTREARLAPRDVDDGASNANDCARGRFRR